jgi:hypothetical protein
VIVLTGHFFDDAVRRRMREAEADFFYHRSELQESADLYRAILQPELARGVPDETDPEAQFRLGVVPGTRINEAVRHSQSTDFANKLASRAGDRSRSWSRLRTSFNDVAHLNPVNADGTPPDRHQSDPSLSQIERFLHWATRAKAPPS